MWPFPADLMRMWPISTRVNKPENDDPIVEPIELGRRTPLAHLSARANRSLRRSCCLITSASSWRISASHISPPQIAARFLMSCRFALRFSNDTLYITIDEKPKRLSSLALKRLRNIAENPAVAVVVDRYDEDWARLGWVMLRGRAEILSEGTEHEQAQALLRSRYPQLGAMEIAQYPVIAVRIERTTSWGNLSMVSGV